MERDNIKFEIANQDQIDNQSFELLRKLFKTKGDPLITNLSSLFDFVDDTHLPGHKLVPLNQIPADDLELYREDIEHAKGLDPEKYHVFQPPVTK